MYSELEIGVCIADEILMWCQCVREPNQKQMGESQGKSENDFHYSLAPEVPIQIQFIVHLMICTWLECSHEFTLAFRNDVESSVQQQQQKN